MTYRRYILVCPDDELLSFILELKSLLDHLDRNGEEIWSPRKLDALEHSIRVHDGNGHLRVEIEALAKAIDEGRFRMRRDDDLRRDFLVFAFRSNLILFLVYSASLVFMILNVDVHSQWRNFPYCCLELAAECPARQCSAGASVFRPLNFIEPVRCFSTPYWARAAGIVTLFLQLRIVDFPVLHV